MQKIVIIMTMLFLTSMPVFAQKILNASVEKSWTVDTAREEVFAGAKEWVELSKFEPYDPDIIENKEAINRGEVELGNRIITIFDCGFYGVIYYSNPKEARYFYKDGTLTSVEFKVYSSPDEYPRKSYKHSYPDGELIGLAIDVAPSNSYIFKPDGKLSVHWVGNICYDVNGNIKMKREAI